MAAYSEGKVKVTVVFQKNLRTPHNRTVFTLTSKSIREVNRSMGLTKKSRRTIGCFLCEQSSPKGGT